MPPDPAERLAEIRKWHAACEPDDAVQRCDAAALIVEVDRLRAALAVLGSGETEYRVVGMRQDYWGPVLARDSRGQALELAGRTDGYVEQRHVGPWTPVNEGR